MKFKYNSIYDFKDNLDNKPYLIGGKLYKLVINKNCDDCAFRSLDKKNCLIYQNFGLDSRDVCITHNGGYTIYIYKLIK